MKVFWCTEKILFLERAISSLKSQPNSSIPSTNLEGKEEKQGKR